MAYDEVGKSLENYKKFASIATKDLLGNKKAKPFIQRIKEADSQNAISSIMASVRKAI